MLAAVRFAGGNGEGLDVLQLLQRILGSAFEAVAPLGANK
jgi:hypothetical protein